MHLLGVTELTCGCSQGLGGFDPQSSAESFPLPLGSLVFLVCECGCALFSGLSGLVLLLLALFPGVLPEIWCFVQGLEIKDELTTWHLMPSRFAGGK